MRSTYLLALILILALATLALFGYGSAYPDEDFEIGPGVAAFFTALGLTIAGVAAARIAPADKRWLISLTIAAFFLRTAFALAIYYGPIDRNMLGEDQPGYDHMPREVLRYWQGLGEQPEGLYKQSNRLGYYSMIAVQYGAFGISSLVPRMFNALAGALMVVYAYRLGSWVFGPAEGRLAALWVCFFPSLVLWSSLNLRDIWLALSIEVIVYHALRLRDKFSAWSLGMIFVGLVWINYNRFYLVAVLGLIVLSILMIARSGRFGYNLVLVSVFALGMFLMYTMYGVGEAKIDYLNLETVNKYRRDLGRETTGRSGYLVNEDVANPAVLAALIPVGVAYFLFSPFPWQISGIRQLVTLPEMIVWYAAVPSVVRAIRQSLRDRNGRVLGLMSAMGLITLAYSIGAVNLGAAYRYRAQIIVFFLLFGAAGLHRRRRPVVAPRPFGAPIDAGPPPSYGGPPPPWALEGPGV
jgi:hypothetical protein